jgi:hypothetical protein
MRSEEKRRASWTALVVLLLAAATAAHGQRFTEMYIPIGQSPGLSGKHTVQGTISAVDAKSRMVTCVYGSETTTAKVTDRTHIWLDRSKAKLSSQKGALSDCVVGRRMEMRYVNDQHKAGAEAEWIKVEVAPGAK